MSEWNPNQYLRFEKERTQPVKDLIHRIETENPKRIIDIGCGPGNSTVELKKRWPSAEIIGLDSSKTMLDKARADYPGITWLEEDACHELTSLGKFDIVFSNAAIQWMPHHGKLIPGFFELLDQDGVLAVQAPNPTQMPIQIAVRETAGEDAWRHYYNSLAPMYYQELGFYYDMLCPLAKRIDLWETHYRHVMAGHEAIIDWYRSTGMRPYLEKLTEDEKHRFIAGVLEKIKQSYRAQKDGSLLFDFRRLFFIAYR